MRVPRWIAATMAMLLLVVLTACGSTTNNQPTNPHPGNAWSRQDFIAAAATLGHTGSVTYDNGSDHWVMAFQLVKCTIELDQTGPDAKAIEIDKVGGDDNITAAKLGLSTLTGVTRIQLEDAFAKPAVQAKVPCAKGFTKPRR